MPFMEWRYTVRGVTFVGETKQPMHIRMNRHMYDISKPYYKVLANHFILPDHSIVVMKVRINRKKNVLEKLVLQCFMDVK
jgi:hypothetical protein